MFFKKYKTKIANQIEEIHQLKSRLSESGVEQLTHDKTKLLVKNSQLESNVHSLTRQLNGEKENNTSLTQQIYSLQQQLDESSNEISTLKISLAQAQESIVVNQPTTKKVAPNRSMRKIELVQVISDLVKLEIGQVDSFEKASKQTLEFMVKALMSYNRPPNLADELKVLSTFKSRFKDADDIKDEIKEKHVELISQALNLDIDDITSLDRASLAALKLFCMKL